jgi:hypothetical protein
MEVIDHLGSPSSSTMAMLNSVEYGKGTKTIALDLPSVQAEVCDQEYLAPMQLVHRGRISSGRKLPLTGGSTASF